MKDAPLTPIPAAEVVGALTVPFTPKEAVDLRDRRVTGALDLRGRELCGFDLSGSLFEGPVLLDGATTRGLSWLRDCRFEAKLSGEGARFGNDLRLDGSVIAGELSLSKAEFWGALVLDGAEVQGTAFLDAMQVLGSLSIPGTRFAAPVSMEGTDAWGGLWAQGARFASRLNATGMEIHGRTWLRDVRMGEGTGLTRLTSQLTLYGYLWS
ncbi:hypothetical protein [Mesobacterium pallidum]|uniref:hypothetical protein n=1 Tax=Mesobacterium pallidum TaxID=2872037 RepID=UPI001EE2D956|nr:hypothetical protein [Mesobacterium pallidum]